VRKPLLACYVLTGSSHSKLLIRAPDPRRQLILGAVRTDEMIDYAAH